MPEQLIKASYPSAWHTRRGRNRGHIKWRGRERFIGRAFVGELVGLKPIADNTHEVYPHGHLIGLLYEQDPAGMRPALIARQRGGLVARAKPPKVQSVTYVMRLRCHPCNETVPVACAPQTRDLLPPYPVRAFVAFGDEVVDPRGENAQRHRAVGADARSSAAPNLTRSAIMHHNRLMMNHVHEARCPAERLCG